MTIEGLKQFLKENTPEIFGNTKIKDFYGNGISIDSNNLLYAFKSTAYKDVVYKTDVCVDEPDNGEISNKLYRRLMDFTIELLIEGITPIFVFDGEHPIQKTKTKEKRRQRKQKIKNNIMELKQQIENTNILSRSPALVTELRKKMCQDVSLTKNDIEGCKNILESIGIPCLQATGDGEKLCAMLCREGKVKAVYSTDSDLIALGTPLSIIDHGAYVYDKETHKRVRTFETMRFDGILDKLKISYETFIDLCIMSGCDYNTNIRGVGIKKSYNFLKSCKSIENLPKHKESIDCLDHDFCRNYFKYDKSTNLCSHEISLNINTDLSESRDKLSTYDMDYVLEKITPIYKNFPHQTSYISRPIQKIKLVLI